MCFFFTSSLVATNYSPFAFMQNISLTSSVPPLPKPNGIVVPPTQPITFSGNGGADLKATPNRSTLFQSLGTVSSSESSSSSSSSGSVTNLSATANGGRPMPNHGKPNCAPKPPGIHQIIAAKNGGSTLSIAAAPTTHVNGSAGRPTVSRHHSMKTPR